MRQLTILPDGKPSGVTVSVGIALCPEHSDSFDMLLTCADLAMYQAKHEKGGRVCVYTCQQKTDGCKVCRKWRDRTEAQRVFR